MLVTRYHIRPDGTVGVCTATVRPCIYGSHFDSAESAEAYNQKLLEVEYMLGEKPEIKLMGHAMIETVRGIPLRATLDKYDNSVRFIQQHNPVGQINKIDRRVFSLQRRALKKKPKSVTEEDFLREWKKTDPEFLAAQEKRTEIKKRYYCMASQRRQFQILYKHISPLIKELNFSAASSSVYFSSEASVEEIKKEFESRGYEVMIRPGSDQVRLCQDHLVRIANHLPKESLRALKKDAGADIWEYTNANVLVTYKKTKTLVSDKEYRKEYMWLEANPLEAVKK